jgi:hypothetical protein
MRGRSHYLPSPAAFSILLYGFGGGAHARQRIFGSLTATFGLTFVRNSERGIFPGDAGREWAGVRGSAMVWIWFM